MPKSNFLLVDLNEKRIKKLAKTITSETSRKILNYLVEKDDSEANIAKSLKIPISTVHYHLQQLQEASLVLVEEFHYSPKGREVNHYKLANKYIIIAPQKSPELKKKLRKILPVGLIALGISAVFGIISVFTGRIGIFESSLTGTESAVQEQIRQQLLDEARTTSTGTQSVSDGAVTNASNLVEEATAKAVSVTTQEPNVLLWFSMGILVTIAILLIVFLVRKYLKKRKNR